MVFHRLTRVKHTEKKKYTCAYMYLKFRSTRIILFVLFYCFGDNICYTNEGQYRLRFSTG